ncbi:MAG: LytTR family transcriptional regulator [Bacteroidales bacterium]|nr:LytTR family transcriptional regulator [Bacteroidales bacterium]MCF8458301.1 LytTR family transcriptional regulator [Bacteroidales bacterium]
MKKRISLSTKNSIFFIATEDILYCRSNNSSTTFYLANGDPVVISKGIKEVEVLLEGNDFIRPHQSYLVNRIHISHVDKTQPCSLFLTNQVRIPISTRKRKEVINRIKTEIQPL